MAGGSAKIGALHVMLGLDSAQFTAGMKKASTGLDKFARNAKIGMAVVATAAAAAGAALAVAVKGAIDNADELSKTAQKVGTTTEALSRLNYAASLSDLSLDQLATGLSRLTVGMSQIAQGAGGQAKMALDALGVSALNTAGQLRGSDEVLADVAERFARMEDGATKTALAIALFGRSGADLIPMLNMGKSGLADLANEADRLGITLSTSTGQAAEKFNDTITTIQATFQGVVNTIMAGALPSLNQLAGKLADPAFAAAAQALAQGVVGAINMIVDAISAAGSKLQEFGNLLDWMSSHDWSTGVLDPDKVDARKAGAMAEVMGQLGRGESEAPSADFMTSIFGAPAAQVAASAQQVATAFEPVIANTEAAAAGASALKAAMSEGKAVFEATRTPAEAYGFEVERLNGLLQKGAIDQDTYSRAILQAQEALNGVQAAGSELASTLESGLTSMFTGIIDGSKSAVEGINDLIKSLADMALQQGFKMLFGNLLGGFGGGGGGLKLGFNGIPGYAEGTNSAAGGLAMVGEQGPELVNLPRGSQVIPNDMLNSGGGTLNVTVVSEVRNGNLIPVMTHVAGQVAGKVVNQQAPMAVARARNDRKM